MPELNSPSRRFSVLSAATAAGHQVNEDAYGLWPRAGAARAAWVLDGVTGINDRALLPGPSDAAWFVAEVQTLLPSLLDQRADWPIADLVSTLASQLASRQTLAWIDPRGADGRETPAASFSMARILGDEVEVAILGDCPVLLQDRSGAVTVSAHPVLERIEEGLKREMLALRAKGFATLVEIRRRMMPALHAARRQRNVPGGYGVLAPEQSCLELLEVYRYPAASLRRILLVSDGYYRLVDHFGTMTDATLLADTGVQGAEQLISEVRRLESDDPEAERFPRFKKSDDATALLVEVA